MGLAGTSKTFNVGGKPLAAYIHRLYWPAFTLYKVMPDEG